MPGSTTPCAVQGEPSSTPTVAAHAIDVASSTPRTVVAAVTLESWNIRERHPARMHVQAAELGAAMQGREHLAGVEQALGVEGAFEPLLLVQIDLGEHRRHQVALLDADAVLAGQHAADLDAELQNVRAEFFGALELTRLVGVVEDERMQIAVAGVEDIGDAQLVVLR